VRSHSVGKILNFRGHAPVAVGGQAKERTEHRGAKIVVEHVVRIHRTTIWLIRSRQRTDKRGWSGSRSPRFIVISFPRSNGLAQSSSLYLQKLEQTAIPIKALANHLGLRPHVVVRDLMSAKLLLTFDSIVPYEQLVRLCHFYKRPLPPVASTDASQPN
jgi:hypothetical protein